MPIITIDNLTLIISLASAFIAIAMFVIASIQTRIQKRNLNLALFNRRYKVYIDSQNESPRVHRRPVCLSQATLPDSFKLS